MNFLHIRIFVDIAHFSPLPSHSDRGAAERTKELLAHSALEFLAPQVKIHPPLPRVIPTEAQPSGGIRSLFGYYGSLDYARDDRRPEKDVGGETKKEEAEASSFLLVLIVSE